ncbi:B3 domain-containing transcription factor VRN1-like [Humulus lupulus]|uniref:B3 domain-containing transcription factor VRN1-like n=1 Tax=Humulus lupulus TaxID=3486 RepID=UPI002B412657|nr:B3 domain-containing transcription factor VRN1-like [Humulus lupulus]
MDSTNFYPVTPHFQRTISQDSLFDNKFKIPREFMLKYANNMDTSNSVVLKVPSGGAWKVKLTKCDGHVWLGEGWPEFARHHSIQCGFSLFFKYEGQFRFHVVILDVNGAEICYKLKPNIDELPKRTEDEDLDCDENLNSHSPYLKRKVKRKLPFFSSPMRRKNKLCVSSTSSSSSSGDDDEYTPEERGNIEDSECFESVRTTDARRFKARAKRGGRLGEHFIPRRKKRTMTVEEKDKALFRTENFTSQNPYFKIVIQKTHVHNRYNMALLTEFWKKHVDEYSGHDVTLYVPNERKTWVVKLQTKARKRCSTPRPTFLRRDWQEFVEDNGLKVGDVCIFELTNKDEMMFKVSINRATECHNRNNQQSEGNMKFGSKSIDHTSGQVTDGAPSSSRDGKSFGGATKQSNPSFEMVLGESVGQVKRLPTDFVNTYLQAKAGVATIQVGKKLWDVNLSSSSGGLVLSGGWPRFAKENHLHPGDSCVFELVSKEMDNTLLKVTISRLINRAVI